MVRLAINKTGKIPDFKTFSHPPLKAHNSRPSMPTHSDTKETEHFNMISVWKRKIKDGDRRSYWSPGIHGRLPRVY